MRVEYENIKVRLNEWRNHYIAITTTVVAETFLNEHYNSKVYYKCRNCGKRVLRTKEVIEIASKLDKNALKQLIKAKHTDFLVFDRGLLVCAKCYHEKKHEIRQYERLGNKRVVEEMLKEISLECIQTKEYKRVVARAYRILEKLFKEGFFKCKHKNGRQNLYYFRKLPLISYNFTEDKKNKTLTTYTTKRAERYYRKIRVPESEFDLDFF